jgi:toxin ParE1/3/4
VKPLFFHKDAEEELEEAARRYEREREGLGLRFQAEVERVTATIQRNPQMWPKHKSTNLRKSLLRKFPYTIFYLEQDDCIWIAAVAHQKRRPGYWMARTPED